MICCDVILQIEALEDVERAHVHVDYQVIASAWPRWGSKQPLLAMRLLPSAALICDGCSAPQTRDQPEHKVDRNLNEGWHLNQPHPNYLHIAQQGSMRLSPSGESVPTSPAASSRTKPMPVP